MYVGYSMEHVGAVEDQIWPLVDSQTASPEVQTIPSEDSVSVNGRHLAVPYNNYLIVSRLPNFLDPRFPDLVRAHRATPHLTVFEGANGIGTRAVDLLLSAAGLRSLEDAADKLDGARNFQLLFEVYGPSSFPFGLHRFTRIRFVAAHDLSDVDTTAWQEAHRYARARIARPVR
jgi:hypothetical protein